MNALSSLASIYSSNAAQVQSQINAIQTQLNSNLKTLTPDEQAKVTTLSTKATGYANVDSSISHGKNVIDVAKTALKSISDLLRQMEQLTQEASTPGISNSDYLFFNARYQKMLTQIGVIASKAQVNGSNLLSGTAVLNVKIGIEINPVTNMTIQPVNVMRMINVGVLSGTRIDDLQSSSSTLNMIKSARLFVSNGLMHLDSSMRQLNAMSASNAEKQSASLDQLNAIQKVDTQALQTQLQILKNQQAINYHLINQFSPDASKKLTILP